MCLTKRRRRQGRLVEVCNAVYGGGRTRKRLLAPTYVTLDCILSIYIIAPLAATAAGSVCVEF